MAQSPSSTAGPTDPPVSPPPHVNGASQASSVAHSIAHSVAHNGSGPGNQSDVTESTPRTTELSNNGDASRCCSREDGSNVVSGEGTDEIPSVGMDTGNMPGISEILEMLATMERKFQRMEARMDQLVPSSLEPPTPSQSLPFVPSPKSSGSSINGEVSVEDTIIAFRGRASLVARGKVLYMAKKFPEWKNRVFEQAKAVTCLPILEEREETCPPDSPVDPRLWKVQNEWLYDYMYESIGPQFKEEIVEPPNRSAYLLWRQIESYCSLVNEDDRRYLIQKLMTINAKNDTEYISMFHKYYSRIRKLGFTIPDWMAQDLLYLRVSERARDMIQSEIDAARNAIDGPFALETDKMVARILNPTLSLGMSEDQPQPKAAPSVNSSIANGPRSTGSKADSVHVSDPQTDTVGENAKVSCGYCSMLYHSEDACFYKYPERTNPAWQKAHKTGIEFFRKKAEGREKLQHLKKQQPVAQPAKKVQIAQKPQPDTQSESKLKYELKPEPTPEPEPEPRQEAQTEEHIKPQAKSQESYKEKFACSYCGQKGHSSSRCLFQFPELAPADWSQKNKHLIEFHARKDKLRKKKLERLKTKQLIWDSNPEIPAPAPETSRPPSPENLLILDL